MTQFDELQEFVRSMDPLKVEKKTVKLGDILGRAQNRPPLGESDGSVSPDTFRAFKRLEKTLMELTVGIRDTQEKTGTRRGIANQLRDLHKDAEEPDAASTYVITLVDGGYIHLDRHSGGYPDKTQLLHHATLWGDEAKAQDYADRFVQDPFEVKELMLG